MFQIPQLISSTEHNFLAENSISENDVYNVLANLHPMLPRLQDMMGLGLGYSEIVQIIYIPYSTKV